MFSLIQIATLLVRLERHQSDSRKVIIFDELASFGKMLEEEQTTRRLEYTSRNW